MSEKVGRYNGLISSIYHDKDGLRTLMDRVHGRDAGGRVRALGGGRHAADEGEGRHGGAGAAGDDLGGALYHLLFEAKAQYAYPYMVYMLPLAAAGLCALEEKLKRSADERQKQQRQHEAEKHGAEAAEERALRNITGDGSVRGGRVLRAPRMLIRQDLTSPPPTRNGLRPATPQHSSIRKLNSASAERTSRPSRQSACSFSC